ncbi:MAG: hypothetical protein ACOYO1_05205 [Bacteroidales bacterium]
MSVGFGTFFNKKTDIYFIVKNVSSSKKSVRLFNCSIRHGRSKDLLSINIVSESDIRHSLLKGELAVKIRSGDIIITNSNIDLLQFSDSQKKFLQDAGVTTGASGGGGGGTAADITYDDTLNPPNSFFQANNVQGVFDMLKLGLSDMSAQDIKYDDTKVPSPSFATDVQDAIDAVKNKLYETKENVLYVSKVTDGYQNGSIEYPFSTISAALDAAASYTTIKVASGTYQENIVMRDLEGIAIIGDSELNTTIVNDGFYHTFYWYPTTEILSFSLKNITFSNTENGYDAIHIDGSNIFNDAAFFGAQFDMDHVNVSKKGAGYTVYLYVLGNCNATCGKWTGGPTMLYNVSVFRAHQIEIGTSASLNSLYVAFEANLTVGRLGRSDNTISQNSIVWGDVILSGHPFFKADSSSVIHGNIHDSGNSLTTYYDAVNAIDYCPLIMISSTVGFGPSTGNINLTLPDPQPSSSSWNEISLSGARICGSVTISKPSDLPTGQCGYGHVNAHNTTFEVNGDNYPGAITADGYVYMNLKGSYVTQSTLTATGEAFIDRDTHVLSGHNIGNNATAIIPIVPPFPPGVSYAVSIEPNQATLTFVATASKLSNQFTLNIAAYDASTACDIIIRRK